jgi:hypothetical protein
MRSKRRKEARVQRPAKRQAETKAPLLAGPTVGLLRAASSFKGGPPIRRKHERKPAGRVPKPRTEGDPMRLRRLGWAGVEIETAGGTLVIDPLENASPLAPHVGEAQRAPPGSRADGIGPPGARHSPALRPRRPGGHSRGARTRRVAAAPGAHAGRGARGRRHGHLGGRHRGARHTNPDLRAVGDGPHRPIRGDGGAY